jgi:hypothetical protein
MTATTHKPPTTGFQCDPPSSRPARSIRFRRLVCSMCMLIAVGSALVMLTSFAQGVGWTCHRSDSVYVDDCPQACSMTVWSPKGPGMCYWENSQFLCTNEEITATPTIWIGTCVPGGCQFSGPGHQLAPRPINSCRHTIYYA